MNWVRHHYKIGAFQLCMKQCLLSIIIKQTNKSFPLQRGIQSTAHFKKRKKWLCSEIPTHPLPCSHPCPQFPKQSQVSGSIKTILPHANCSCQAPPTLPLVLTTPLQYFIGDCANLTSQHRINGINGTIWNWLSMPWGIKWAICEYVTGNRCVLHRGLLPTHQVYKEGRLI